ncbi:MAG: hypothetical protein Q7U26_06420, partial [Aquabacterium sp.]|nr:hypothetical protein [Aquabacterium sp.]
MLDQLDRDDPAHARRRLLADLSQALGRQARWLDDTAAAPQTTADGHLVLPLRHLGHALGSLCLQPGDGLSPADTAQALAGITRTLAALLLHERKSSVL